MRFRYVYMFVAFALFPMLLLLTDPDIGMITTLASGSQLVQFLLNTLAIFLFIGILHFSRKALFDYEDLKQVRDKAIQTPEGAGYWAIAIGIFVLAISVVIHAVITVSTV
jgi:hypothetical protein